MRAGGGMITFQLRGGLGAAITLAERIKLWSYATSLGHAHSLLFYYPTDLYVDAAAYLSGEQKSRIRQWTGDGIVRASVGLESPGDLIADLDQALRGRSFKGWIGPLAYRRRCPPIRRTVEIRSNHDHSLCFPVVGRAPLGPGDAAGAARTRLRAGADRAGDFRAGGGGAREIPLPHGGPVPRPPDSRAGARADHPRLVREQPQQRLLRRVAGGRPT